MAGTEVFRFVTICPPRQPDPKQPPVVIDLAFDKSTFAAQLRNQRSPGGREGMMDIAVKFVASTDFITSTTSLDPKLVAFVAALRSIPDENFWTAAQHAFDTSIGGSAQAYVNGDIFGPAFAHISDSIVAAAIDDTVNAKVRGLLVEVACALGLIRRLATSAPLTRASFANAALVMPTGIFPLPVSDPSLKGQRTEKAAANATALEARRRQVAQLAQDLADHREATDELLAAFELTAAQSVPAAAAAVSGTSGRATRPPALVLASHAVSALSNTTLACSPRQGSPPRISTLPAVSPSSSAALSASRRSCTPRPALAIGSCASGRTSSPAAC